MELISNILHYLLPFICILTVLVFVHEFGHFWVARRAGVKIEVFSIGFGKELLGFNDKYGTRWKFCLIPMGGYVKMFGDKTAASNSDDELINSLSAEEQKMAFQCKNIWQKVAIVIAGPAANYLFAALIFTAFFSYYGYPSANSVITKILPDSPASRAGIEPGDIVISINGQAVRNFNDIMNAMALNMGDDLTLVFKKHDELIAKQIKPKQMITKDILGNDVTSYKLGIMTEHVVLERQNIFAAMGLAVNECYQMSVMSLRAIGQMIIGKRSAKELGGPIKIAQYSAKSSEEGVSSLIWFMALLSVNLGFINLLPIPVLDGGHLLIYLVEVTVGKKIASKMQNYGFQIGIILLIMLTMFVTFNDLNSLTLFSHKG